MASTKTAYLSTTVSAQLKEALTKFCRRRGFKINHFIEEAILEHLEDEEDLATYEVRRHEKKITLDELLKTIE